MAKQGQHGISWCEETWNPIRGCSRVSEGCRNCYAERVAARFSGPGQPYEGLATFRDLKADLGMQSHWTGVVRFIEEHLEDPLHWKRPRMIFVNSMSDLFHEKVSDEWLVKIFNVMIQAEQHTFQCLTKRPERMLAWMRHLYEGRIAPAPPHNVWMGVSVEDQKTADERIPLLLQTPAAIRWVSYEPALGPVDFTNLNPPNYMNAFGHSFGLPNLDWIVCGGESGPGARPMHPSWARAVRDQCVVAGVAFHFKQWGEFLPKWTTGAIEGWENEMQRVGKRAAGRLLDGKEWNQFPIL